MTWESLLYSFVVKKYFSIVRRFQNVYFLHSSPDGPYWDDECYVHCLQETNHWVLAPQVCKLDQFKTHPSCSRPAQRLGSDHVQIPPSHWSLSSLTHSDWPRICNLSSSSHSGCSYQQGFLNTFFSSLIILVFPSLFGSCKFSFIVRHLPC